MYWTEGNDMISNGVTYVDEFLKKNRNFYSEFLNILGLDESSHTYEDALSDSKNLCIFSHDGSEVLNDIAKQLWRKDLIFINSNVIQIITDMCKIFN